MKKLLPEKLDSSEYYYNPQIGFLSLNQQLQPNDVLAVAYQYTYNGRVYQVGEFFAGCYRRFYAGRAKSFLFLKLLKSHLAKSKLTYLGFDDEKCLLARCYRPFSNRF